MVFLFSRQWLSLINTAHPCHLLQGKYSSAVQKCSQHSSIITNTLQTLMIWISHRFWSSLHWTITRDRYQFCWRSTLLSGLRKHFFFSEFETVSYGTNPLWQSKKQNTKLWCDTYGLLLSRVFHISSNNTENAYKIFVSLPLFEDPEITLYVYPSPLQGCYHKSVHNIPFLKANRLCLSVTSWKVCLIFAPDKDLLKYDKYVDNVNGQKFFNCENSTTYSSTSTIHSGHGRSEVQPKTDLYQNSCCSKLKKDYYWKDACE